MMRSNSVITPSRHILRFGFDERFIEAVCEDEELRPLVPGIDEMFDDIEAAAQFDMPPARADDPTWEDLQRPTASDYARIARGHLINAGCIFAEHDRYEDLIYFTGLADVLKRRFKLCLKLAEDSQPVLNIVRPPCHWALQRRPLVGASKGTSRSGFGWWVRKWSLLTQALSAVDPVGALVSFDGLSR